MRSYLPVCRLLTKRPWLISKSTELKSTTPVFCTVDWWSYIVNEIEREQGMASRANQLRVHLRQTNDAWLLWNPCSASSGTAFFIQLLSLHESQFHLIMCNALWSVKYYVITACPSPPEKKLRNITHAEGWVPDLQKKCDTRTANCSDSAVSCLPEPQFYYAKCK